MLNFCISGRAKSGEGGMEGGKTEAGDTAGTAGGVSQAAVLRQ